MLTPCFLLNMLHCWVQKLQEMMYVSKHMNTKVFVCIKVEVENQAWISVVVIIITTTDSEVKPCTLQATAVLGQIQADPINCIFAQGALP